MLHRAARAFNVSALSKLQARGHTALSLAHTNLLPHLDTHGSSIVKLAERAGMTKQAAGQLIAELEQHGYLTRRADPSDRRAVQIDFTPAGWQYLLDAQVIKREIVAEYRAKLGEATWETLNEALSTLLK